jgi:hypothetical protein
MHPLHRWFLTVILAVVSLPAMLAGQDPAPSPEPHAGSQTAAAPDTSSATVARDSSGGEAPEPEERKPRSWMALPHLFYTPETELAGGAVAAYMPGGGVAARPSSLFFSLTYTSRKQVIGGVVPELYLRGGTLWVQGEATAMKFPDVFYGVGNRTTPEDEEAFTVRSSIFLLQAQREVVPGSWVGLRAHVQSETFAELDDGGLLERGLVTGFDGGRVVGLGTVVTRDTRDRAIGPRSGVLAEARSTGYHGAIGSERDFALLSLDVRGYRPVGSGTLALRGRVQSAHGETPFTLLPALGGDRMLRGYRGGRFRDDHAAVLESEYRFPLFWRFGAVLYGGVGDVAADADAFPAPGELERAAGAGLRFRLNEAGINVRIDWARGREAGGLYVGIGEAF